MLTRNLFITAALTLLALSAHGAAAPASAGPNIKPKVKIAPSPRIRVVRPKVRIKIRTKQLAEDKKEKKATDKKQETATIQQKTVPAQASTPSSRRSQNLANVPPVPLRTPRIAALDLGKAERWAELSDAGRALRQLREMGLLEDSMGIFGAGVLGPPTQQPDAPGSRDRFGGNQNEPPVMAELSPTIQTEGAADVASFFTGDIPKPGAGSPPSAPDGPGERHPGARRPQPGQVPAGTRPSDVPDPRGLASDGTDRDEFNEDGSGTRTEYDDDEGYTVTTYDKDGSVTTRSNYDSGDRIESLRNYDPNGNVTLDVQYFYRPDGTWHSTRTDWKTGTTIRTVRGRPVRSDQPLPIDGGSDTSDWSHLCGSFIPSYMCRTRSAATPMDMLGQPDDDNGEGGVRDASYSVAQFLDRGAVTNTGDSSFSTIPGPGLTPGEAYGGGGPTPLPGPCINC